MSSKPHESAGSVPEECLIRMKQLLRANYEGEFDRCMGLQKKLHKSLRKHGLPAYNLPITYFKHIYEMREVLLSGDDERLDDIKMIIMALQMEAGIKIPGIDDYQPTQNLPVEYPALQEKARMAADAEDWTEYQKVLLEANALCFCLGNYYHGDLLEDPVIENYPGLYSLTYLAIEINGALEANPKIKLSFKEVYDGLEKRDLLQVLDKRLSKLLSFDILLNRSEELEATYETLGMVADYLRGREDHKMGIKKSGIHLLLAFVIEAIQQQYWIPPNR